MVPYFGNAISTARLTSKECGLGGIRIAFGSKFCIRTKLLGIERELHEPFFHCFALTLQISRKRIFMEVRLVQHEKRIVKFPYNKQIQSQEYLINEVHTTFKIFLFEAGI